MPDIPYAEPTTLNAETQSLLARLPNYNIFRMLSRCEGLFVAFIRFNNAVLNNTDLDPVLREAAIIRVGHRAFADYEVHHHERIGRTLGMDDDLLRRLDPATATSPLPERLAAVVQAADELSKHSRLGSSTLARLQLFLSDRELLELVFSIGCYMMVARLLLTSGVEIEPEGSNDPLAVRGVEP